ncbi:MAG: stage II sporulation protein R [Ruminococcus sp.]|nr:stage II sporulation protein R [Ruminococcus sp.]
MRFFSLKKHRAAAAAAIGLLLAVVISDTAAVVRDGRRLDGLRDSVLRLHILADSDDEEAQRLKLLVRDEVLELSGDIFSGADSREEAEMAAAERLGELEAAAETVLRENGCGLGVSAAIEDVYFDERTYGDITMPAGKYRAVRLIIGSGSGHNWWCVMYPALCIPAAVSGKDTGELFTEEELDILYKPEKYRVRFVVWDKIKEITGGEFVKSDENYRPAAAALDKMREKLYNIQVNKEELYALTVGLS